LLAELRAAQVDQLVLGCTHFTFVTPLLQAAMGDEVTIVDPAPAVARQVERVLNGAVEPPGADTVYFTTGDTDIFQRQVRQLLDIPNPDVRSLQWVDGVLTASGVSEM
jgi:glutamate racemase